MSAFVPAASAAAAAWLFDHEDDPRADTALTHFENDAALVGAAVAEELALIEPMNASR